ncbi:MAG: SRPBCC domain-containing protein [Candidatus Korobacteraceae bacterium]
MLYNKNSNVEAMMSEGNYRILLADAPTRRQMIVGAAVAFGGVALGSVPGWASDDLGISHTCAAIHQEVVFKASPKRVYEALIDAKQFNKVIQLSAAVKSGAKLGDKPTDISPEAGGAFTLYGGYITGRQIELVPSQRIVQAWRTGGWEPGIYSIAKFQFTEQGSDTKLVFDHTGFPVDQAQHLATGWHINYWEPLAKNLA